MVNSRTEISKPISHTDGHGERNPRVLLKAKVIQAASQLNPDRDKIFSFLGQQSSNSNLFQTNFARQFRIGRKINYLRT